MHTAAYLELFVRFNVGGCNNQRKADEIADDIALVTAWADEQPEDVRAAYRWAIEQSVVDLANRVAAKREAWEINYVYRALPKPPL